MSKSAGDSMSDSPQSDGAPCTDFPSLAPLPALGLTGPRRDGGCLHGRRKVALSGYTDMAFGMDIVAHGGLLIANRFLVHERNGA